MRFSEQFLPQKIMVAKMQNFRCKLKNTENDDNLDVNSPTPIIRIYIRSQINTIKYMEVIMLYSII